MAESTRSSSLQAPLDIHPSAFLAGAKIVSGGDNPASADRRRTAVSATNVPPMKKSIKDLSDEDRKKIRSAEISFDWRDIPREEYEYHKSTVRSEDVSGRGFWSFPQPERMHRPRDKYREEIIEIWVAKFAALGGFVWSIYSSISVSSVVACGVAWGKTFLKLETSY
ncbi:MAG: hypothetical protein M1812_003768 [Candelaria pacifica]|nr:MAG: hypothetical protein M1812_003768 [Candelaria pacifica]